MVDNPAEHDGTGYLIISDRPGIGINLKPGGRENIPMTPREVITRLHADGSVMDQ
jgi:galactonate dehydratase